MFMPLEKWLYRSDNWDRRCLGATFPTSELLSVFSVACRFVLRVLFPSQHFCPVKLIRDSSMDIIFLQELKVKTLIGIYPWELKVAQTIQLDLEVHCRQAGPVLRITQDRWTMRSSSDASRKCLPINISLLEALAEHVAQIVLTEFKSPWVRISVAKLSAIRGVKKVGYASNAGRRKHNGCCPSGRFNDVRR